MDTNYSLGRLNSQSDYSSTGIFYRTKEAQFFKEFPVESFTREQEMDDWWEHIAGGWSPDKLTNGKH